MHQIRGGVVNITLDLAGDLRPVFADASAVKQHAFGYVAGLLDELSIVGHNLAKRHSRLHELYQFIEDFHTNMECALQFSWDLAETGRLDSLRDVATVFRFELRIDHVAGLERTMGCDARGPRDIHTRAPVGH